MGAESEALRVLKSRRITKIQSIKPIGRIKAKAKGGCWIVWRGVTLFKAKVVYVQRIRVVDMTFATSVFGKICEAS